jgi:hypothetical protein
VKLNPDLAFPQLTTEDDAAEMGKGDEFARQQYAVSWETGSRINKHLTSQAASWAWCFALGGVTAVDRYSRTVVPQDPQIDGIELPYFSVLQQFRPNQVGGAPLDQLIVGCAINELTININAGAGRQASQLTAGFVGTGKFIEPSGYTLPAQTPEVLLPNASATVSINGVDYIGNANRGRLNRITLGVRNNFDQNSGFFIGSGSQIDGAPQTGAVRGRMEFVNREYPFDFEVRLKSSSAEFAALRSLSSGTASVGIRNGPSDAMTVTYPNLGFRSVVLSDTNGIATLQITTTVKSDPALGPIIVSVQNGTLLDVGV